MDIKDEQKPAEQKAVEPETTQVESPPTEAQPTEEQTTVTTEESDVSQTMSEEQRRAFQEMRLENKRLREETEARKKSESAFDVFRPQPQPLGIDPNQFIDPNTGERNEYAYQQAIARNARAEAQSATKDELDEYQARQKHPELFSDPEAEEEIAGLYFFNKARGNNVSVSQIAERVAKRYQKAVTKAEKIGAEKILTEVSPKEQAALAASSPTSSPARQAQSDEDLERLRQQSRGRGRASEEAVAQRMKNIPWSK